MSKDICNTTDLSLRNRADCDRDVTLQKPATFSALQSQVRFLTRMLTLQHAATQRAQSPDGPNGPSCNDVTEEELAQHEADREAAKVNPKALHAVSPCSWVTRPCY